METGSDLECAQLPADQVEPLADYLPASTAVSPRTILTENGRDPIDLVVREAREIDQ